MIAIVAHHYVVNSGVLQVMESEPLTLKSAFFYLFGMWGKIGINCFVLITGYFMCRQDITLRKFLKLLFQVMFYNITVNAVFVVCGYVPFNKGVLYDMLWPIKSVGDGFVSCFLVFYLCIPFLNVLVRNIDKRQHQLLLALCLFVYTVLGTTTKVPVTINYVTWFGILYFISSYIRFYGICFGRVKIGWGWMSVSSVAVSAASVLLIAAMTETPGREFILVADSNHIMAVVTSVCLFMFFKDLPMKNSKFINTVASTTFGVLLIHANSNTMRHWLWRDTLDNVGFFSTDNAVLHAIVSVATVFVVCSFIDYLRVRYVEKPFFKHVLNKIKLPKIFKSYSV